MPLSKKKINLLREFTEFICEECKKPEKEVGKLQPHRICRGYRGGEYCMRNIKMVCKKCHDLYHFSEF